MANPQPDEFTKISNELFKAIMQSDFTKRQRNILDLVMRMSYGCGKKTALLKPVDFELVGVYKTHVKKELDYLVAAAVLIINGDEIALNKDYDKWRIGMVKGAVNEERWNRVLKRNLSHKVTETVTTKNEKVTETVTSNPQGGYQNSNSMVTKTVTSRDSNAYSDKGCQPRKERERNNISNSYIGNPPVDNVDNQDGLKRTANEYTNCGYGTINSVSAEILKELTSEYSAEWVCAALKIGLEQNKRSLSYVRGILENWKRNGGMVTDKPVPTEKPKRKTKFDNFEQHALKYTNEELKALWAKGG